jgi:hypothetical protein
MRRLPASANVAFARDARPQHARLMTKRVEVSIICNGVPQCVEVTLVALTDGGWVGLVTRGKRGMAATGGTEERTLSVVTSWLRSDAAS